ncbi:MAG TPA: ABC transporter permease [Acidobacteriota bacterium]|nr:ABC transporter permease [Acidobacteriota bacterium]
MKNRGSLSGEMIRLAVVSIWAHKLRAFLTLLGVIIGVSSVVVVGASIEGAEQYVVDSISGALGGDTFNLTRFAPNLDQESVRRAQRRNPRLTIDDYEFVRGRCSACDEIAAFLGTAQTVRRGAEEQRAVTINGTTSNAILVSTFDIAAGRFLTPDDVRRSHYVTVIGKDVEEELFPSRDPMGQRVKVSGYNLTVVGVMAEQGSTFGQSLDNQMYIPISTFQKIYGTRSSINIRGNSLPGRFQEAMDEVRVAMRVRHKLSPREDDDFGLISTEEINTLVQDVGGYVQLAVAPITLISLLIGGIVVMNIMLVSVTERTFEIGLRKSLGARKRDILLQFLVESILLGSLGGLIGMLVSWQVTTLIELIFEFPMEISAFYVISSIAVSGGIGLAAGLYPAFKAASLDPILALSADR